MSKKKDNFKKEIKDQSIEALNAKLILLKKELFNLRFQKSLGDLKNTSRFGVVRKDIAKIHTELVARRKMGEK